MATAQASLPSRQAQPQQAKRDWLAEVKSEAVHRPSAMVIMGPPHVGKSSLAGNIPGILAMPFAQENTWGLLKESGAVPKSLPVLPPIASWNDLLAVLDSLSAGVHQYKALALDTLGCAERLCHEHVCQEFFKGEWGERGFGGYQRGNEVALAPWRTFLTALDRLRDERGMSIVLLAHTRVRNFKNPAGPDFDRYCADVHDKTWALTHRWADAVLFANYFVTIDDKGIRAKGKGGQQRILYTEYDAAFDAKNRFGLPAEIEMGSSGAEAWKNLAAAIKASRK